MPVGRQDAQHPGFVAADQAYDCTQCVRIHGERHGFPPLEEANLEAWEFYDVLIGQVRIGMDVVGLDMTAIPVAFDIYDVPRESRRLLFEKLMIIDRAVQENRGRARERERIKAKAAEELRKVPS